MTDWEVPATVERVIDGDTVVMATLDLGWHVQLGGEHVRLYGIDTPELNTDEGKAARDFVEALLPPGAEVTLVSHKLLGESDKYGRTLASITLPDGRDLSTLLIQEDYAVPYMV